MSLSDITPSTRLLPASTTNSRLTPENHVLYKAVKVKLTELIVLLTALDDYQARQQILNKQKGAFTNDCMRFYQLLVFIKTKEEKGLQKSGYLTSLLHVNVMSTRKRGLRENKKYATIVEQPKNFWANSVWTIMNYQIKILLNVEQELIPGFLELLGFWS